MQTKQASVFFIGVACLGIFLLLFGSASGQCGPEQVVTDGSISDYWWIADFTTREIVSGAPSEFTGEEDYGPGVVGKAFSFGAAAQNVTVEDSQAWDFGPCDFSISLWARANSEGSTAPLIAHDEGPGDVNKWIFWVQPWGGLTFHINSSKLPPGVGGLNIVTYGEGGFFLTPGQWYHLAVTKSGTRYVLYVNGRRAAGAEGPLKVPSATAPLTIGQAEEFLFDGMIDEVKIFKRGLSHAEVRTYGYLQGAWVDLEP